MLIPLDYPAQVVHVVVALLWLSLLRLISVVHYSMTGLISIFDYVESVKVAESQEAVEVDPLTGS